MLPTDAEMIATLADDITAWLRDQLNASGAERFVLGLSGGVDSALVAALCCRAAEPERVLGAIMPSQSSPADTADARLVAQTFQMTPVEIALTAATETFLGAMPAPARIQAPETNKDEAESRQQLAVANVRPRLRMTTLYYLAALGRGLVVGTGNKSEARIGYFTKYGDGGVDLLPIADLYKHEVWAMAAELGVPKRIIDKAPSAGLWSGQTDEAEIGLSYDELDTILMAIERGDVSGIDPAKLAAVQAKIRGSEHKRRPIPAFRRRQPATTVPA